MNEMPHAESGAEIELVKISRHSANALTARTAMVSISKKDLVLWRGIPSFSCLISLYKLSSQATL